MRCLTVCEPYATLLMLPDDDPRKKFVENRTWHTAYRGALLIHAGKSRKFLSGNNYGLRDDELTFGAILGVGNLVDCLSVNVGPDGSLFNDPTAFARHPHLKGHRHVEGPFCLVLAGCRRFAEPIPYLGKQGFFQVPNKVVAEALKHAS